VPRDESTVNPHQPYRQSTSQHRLTSVARMQNAFDYLAVVHLPKHLRVTERGMQLRTGQPCQGRIREDILHRIYFLESWVFEQAEPSNPENGVEDVDHVSRTVC
jgi:hypothetical protein